MRNYRLPVALSATLSLSFGCSSADVDSGGESAPNAGAESPSDPAEPHPSGSPGGATPSSVVDGECGIDSGFPGDELCILPPDPTEGIQLWVGPTDYDDPDAVAPYLLEASGEDVVCYNDLASDGGFYYLEQRSRMRSGSHHMLIALREAAGREEGPTAECDLGTRIGSVPGSQTPRRDFLAKDFAPEDQGLGRWFPEDAMASFQLHYVNTTDQPVMREAWVNLYRRDEAEVTDPLNTIFLVGDISVSVPPQTRQTTPLSFTPTLTEPLRIFELTGHSHAHNERFSVWRNRGTADEALLYESYDWAEPIVLRFNSVIENPLPDPVTKTDGGLSGQLFMEPGDSLTFECEVNNTTDQVLTFANEAYTAEMCLLGGAHVGGEEGVMAGGCADGSCFDFSGFLGQ